MYGEFYKYFFKISIKAVMWKTYATKRFSDVSSTIAQGFLRDSRNAALEFPPPPTHTHTIQP